MLIEKFWVPRLVGSRFEGASIPLDVLKDFAVLEEMIIEVAKTHFLNDHPERVRAPRGFSDGAQLKLSAVESGSAQPVISLDINSQPTLFPENQTYFERARNSIIDAVRAANHDQSITVHLEERALSYFDRFGRSLHDDEYIELSTEAGSSSAILSRDSRRKLVLASSKLKELTEESVIRGTIPEADQDNMSFEIQTLSGRKIKAPIPTQHLDTIVEAFSGYNNGTRIIVQGIGKFSRTGRLLGFETIEHINILDPLDVPARLEEFESLKNGWIEGRGIAPSKEGLQWLAHEFSKRFPDDLPLPYTYPTSSGGVFFEWYTENCEISLEVDIVNRIGEFHVLWTDKDEELYDKFSLLTPEDWDNYTRVFIEVLNNNE